MGTHRFINAAVNYTLLQDQVGPDLSSVSSPSFPVYVDVVLSNDAVLPDLQTAMAEQGWSYVSSNPTTPLPTITSAEYEVDFGSAPSTDARFTISTGIVATQALATSRVSVVLSGNTATGRAQGDAQWDSLIFGAVPSTGSLIVYATCPSGSVVGKRKIIVTIDNT